MTLHGYVQDVRLEFDGNFLTIDADVDATTLQVDDVSPFQEDGGSLMVVDDTGQEIHTYTSADFETDQLTLSTGLSRLFAAGTRVLIDPPSEVTIADVQLDDDELEPIPARVTYSMIAQLPLGMRSLISGEDEIDAPMLPEECFVELVRSTWYVTEVIGTSPVFDGSYLDPTSVDLGIPDGAPPGSSPVPVTVGGVDFVALSWAAISNHDIVTYEIHVSLDSSFSPIEGDTTTMVGETSGTLMFVHSLPDGTPLDFGTNYYFAIIAKDADGAAVPSDAVLGTPGQATGPDIAANAISANHILAGAITAEKLAAVIVLASKIIAGAEGSARLELGADIDTGFVGLTAYSADGTTVTFSIDAQTGEVYVRGRVDFGTNSRLRADDAIELSQQSANFLVPGIAQTAFYAGHSTNFVVPDWPSPTTKGSTLLAILTGTSQTLGSSAPVVSVPPSGWTQVGSAQINSTWYYGSFSPTASFPSSIQVYKLENASSRQSTESFLFNSTGYISARIFEIVGADVQDVQIKNGGSGATVTVGPTGTTSQAAEIWLAAFYSDAFSLGFSGDPTNGFLQVANGTTGSGYLRVVAKDVLSTGSVSVSNSLISPSNWLAAVITFKAKSAGIEAPDTGLVKLYAKPLRGTTALAAVTDDGIEEVLSPRPSLSLPSRYYSSAEFMESAGSQSGIFIPANGGTGSGVSNAASTTTHPGIWTCATGTTNSGNARVQSNSDALRIGGGRIRFGCWIRTPGTLSNGTDTYTIYVGLLDSTLESAVNDGVYIRYRHSLILPWQGRAIAGGSGTTTSLGTNVATNQWYFLELEINAAGNSVQFYQDGAAVGSPLTTIPASSTGMRVTIGIEKSAGTSSRGVDVDAAYVQGELGMTR